MKPRDLFPELFDGLDKDRSLSVTKFVNNCIKRAIPLDRIPELFNTETFWKVQEAI